VPHWRQDYPNKLPPKLAAVASEKGQCTKSLRDSGGVAWLRNINQVRDRR